MVHRTFARLGKCLIFLQYVSRQQIKLDINLDPHSIEVEDTYSRLNEELKDLLPCLDQKVGKNNYVLFLKADHGAEDVPASLKDRGLQVDISIAI